MVTEAVILAGGFGTRLQQKVRSLPKPMAPINNKPFVEYVVDHLIGYGIKTIIFSTGYKSDMIKSHFGSHFRGVSFCYSVEDKPLGTGGAIKKAMEITRSENILVLNGDTLFRINLNEFHSFHTSTGADVTIALRKTESVKRYGEVSLAEKDRIISFNEKNDEGGSGYMNGGIYLFNRESLFIPGQGDRFSIEKDFFEKMTGNLTFYGFKSNSYFIDIGTPEDYERACNEL